MRLSIDDVHVCSPSTVNTAKGSGRLSNSLFANPLALKSLTLSTLSVSSDNLLELARAMEGTSRWLGFAAPDNDDDNEEEVGGPGELKGAQ